MTPLSSDSGDLIGTRWRGASGNVWTVERVEGRVAHGKWDSGILWAEIVSMIPKLYVEVDGSPVETPAVETAWDALSPQMQARWRQ